MRDLLELLRETLPSAIAWAEGQAAYALGVGMPLSPGEAIIARRVGVQHPERIRVVRVEALPVPEDPRLREAARKTGLLGDTSIGLTLGHGIYVVRGHETIWLLSHECRHVYQYENYGSIAAFLSVYLEQVVLHGYQEAPLEVDARAYEIFE